MPRPRVAAAQPPNDVPRDENNAPSALPPNGTVNVRVVPLLPPAPTLLAPETRPIDLNTALQLAGVQNPELMIARQRVVEAAALRQLAAVQFLPSINVGGNYDGHTGLLQQSNGNILSVNRNAVYVGAGANAVAAGTVNIPGVVLTGNVAVAVFGFLTSRQVVAQREFASVAVRNQAFLATTIAYSELFRAEGKRPIANQVRQEAHPVATDGQLRRIGAGAPGRRRPRRDRAGAARERRAGGRSGGPCRLGAAGRGDQHRPVDPAPPDGRLGRAEPDRPRPHPALRVDRPGVVPEAGTRGRRAAIREAFLALEGSHALPFSPTILLGFSAGGFGGGSNLVQPVFGGFGGRQDIDAIAYWTLQNMGVGNLALINVARSRLRLADYQFIAVLDRVRAEVAEAYARTHARYAQIGTAERRSARGSEVSAKTSTGSSTRSCRRSRWWTTSACWPWPGMNTLMQSSTTTRRSSSSTWPSGSPRRIPWHIRSRQKGWAPRSPDDPVRQPTRRRPGAAAPNPPGPRNALNSPPLPPANQPALRAATNRIAR